MATLNDSRKQEQMLAKNLDGTVNAGSGTQWLRKGDVRTDNELFELKITSAKSYSLKDAELEKTYNQALVDGRIPVFMVEFKSTGNAWIILSKEDYLTLREEANIGNEITQCCAAMV